MVLTHAALCRAALRRSALPCAALPCAALRCAALHCAALRCPSLPCAALRCTASDFICIPACHAALHGATLMRTRRARLPALSSSATPTPSGASTSILTCPTWSDPQPPDGKAARSRVSAQPDVRARREARACAQARWRADARARTACLRRSRLHAGQRQCGRKHRPLEPGGACTHHRPATLPLSLSTSFPLALCPDLFHFMCPSTNPLVPWNTPQYT